MVLKLHNLDIQRLTSTSVLQIRARIYSTT